MNLQNLPTFIRAVVLSGLTLTSARAVSVDSEIVILVDAQSQPTTDFDVILDSVARAFEDSDFRASALGGLHGSIASSVIIFNANGEHVGVPWMEMSSNGDFDAFAAAVRNVSLPAQLWGVNYASAITTAALSIANTAIDGTLKQITIIDDGSGFWEADPNGTQNASQLALASGVDVINAVVFDARWQEQRIADYYNANVVNTAGGGTVNVVGNEGWQAKQGAILDSIQGAISQELTAPTLSVVPEPGVAGLFGLAFLFAGRRNRRA